MSRLTELPHSRIDLRNAGTLLFAGCCNFLNQFRRLVDGRKHLFQQLEATLKGGTAITHRDFTSALEVLKTEGVAALRSLHTERIHTSQRKAHVLPKTTGQKKYVEAIRTHDVTLGVGPAVLLAIPLYHFSIFDLGLPLIPFFACLMIMGWGIGLAVCGR